MAVSMHYSEKSVYCRIIWRFEEARQDCPDPKVLIEQRLDFSCYVPDGFGTGDCLIVADKLLHIICLLYTS